MSNCPEYRAYLNDKSGKIKFPCVNCADWVEKTDTCLFEAELGDSYNCAVDEWEDKRGYQISTVEKPR